MDFAVPYAHLSTGRTATATPSRHLRDLIEAVLFTSPGERVNRPDFGCGLIDLLFEGNTPALAAATEMTVQGSLQRWLGERIEVHQVQVQAEEAVLTVVVEYLVRATEERRVDTFEMRA